MSRPATTGDGPFGRAPRGGDARFEALLSSLSARLIHAPAHEVDSQLERGLGEVAGFLGVDRSCLSQFSADGRELVVTHSHTLPGIPPFPRADLAATMPWATARIRAGAELRFSRFLEEAPPEAAAEKQYCLRTGFRSNLIIPFRVGASVLGSIGFCSFSREMAWPDAVVTRMRLVSEVFANALARKMAAEKESLLREQLAHAARVTLLGELAASIAHEVNQPLCAILGNAEAARLVMGQGGDAGEAVEAIARDTQRAVEVIARIRGLFRKSLPERSAVDINALVGEAVSLARAEMARRGVEVRLELAEALPPVRADRVQIQQVLLNLIANGADAVSGLEAHRRLVMIRSAADGPAWVGVAVEDGGAGLDPEGLSRVFDAFYTTKPAGLGMGLAVSKSIIEWHGGRIAAESGGAGSTFRFTLPAH